MDQNSPERLVAELRLAQFSALLLAFVAGAFIGFSATSEVNVNTAVDAALALGFLWWMQLHLPVIHAKL
jgi:formate/nitrite transporter FocA (FNT family)